MNRQPCRGCVDRVEACHDHCKAYQQVDFMNKHRTDIKKREGEIRDYMIKTMYRKKK